MTERCEQRSWRRTRMRRNSGGRGSFVLDAGAGALGPVIARRARGRGHFPASARHCSFFPSQFFVNQPNLHIAVGA